MMTGRNGDRLGRTDHGCGHDSPTPLTGFTRNLRRDVDASVTGMALTHSSGAAGATSTG